MDRRKAIQTLAVGSVVVGLTSSSDSQVLAQGGGIQPLASGEYGDSEILNGASGLRVVTNAVDDYSLKIISGDGTKSLTVIRYKGLTAWNDIQLAYQHLQTFLLLLKLDV